MQIPQGKKIYFLSDFHLGAPDHASSMVREKRIVKFLQEIRDDAAIIFIAGDLFDFWFEYSHVVPKGFIRILGKLAELTDAGIGIHFFVGNHDMWMKGYFEKELGVEVHHDPREFEMNGKLFFIGHGDGIGPGDRQYKITKRVFRNRVAQWLFRIMHPGLGIRIANYFSRRSRKKSGKESDKFLGEEKEWQIIYAKEMLSKKHVDYFIFGHRHFPLDIPLDNGSRYINLGDWISNFSYGVFDGETFQLKQHLG